MNGELLRDLALLSAGVTASAAGAALLVLRVLLSPALGRDTGSEPRSNRRR